MNFESEWNNFMKRSENFYWNLNALQTSIIKNDAYYKALYNFKINIINFIKENKLRPEQILEKVFSDLYNFVTMNHFELTYFLKGSPLYDSAYNACLFSSLCMFLHSTKRTDGMSLSKFTYENSPFHFNIEGTYDYCPPNSYSSQLISDSSTLRKKRNRLLSSRPVYIQRPQWSAMSEDLVYEWNLYYFLEGSPSLATINEWCLNHNLTIEEFNIIQDTYKRIGNLNKDLHKALNAEKNSSYKSNLENAYEHYMSKLKKLKYENYLKLQKSLLSYHCEERKYYGIRIYRLEKEFRPYNIMYEVNQLRKCETVADEDAVMTKSIILKDIFFPKLYKNLSELPVYSDIESCSKYFGVLNNLVVTSSCLIFDELIEENYLGNDWKDFFDDILYELTEKVFYNPDEIDYTIDSKSQDAFIKILSAPVRDLLSRVAGITFDKI